jgi:hypothetical protein
MIDSFFDVVLQAVKEWNPKAEYTTENKYRDDLLKFLREKLNHSGSGIFSSTIWSSYSSGQHHLIKKEAGRSLADIGIDNKIGIELKLNLRTKSQVDRLFGQVGNYLDGYPYIIIVLCGHTNQEKIEDLKYMLRKINTQSPLFGQEKLIRIIFKDESKNPRKAKNHLASF